MKDKITTDQALANLTRIAQEFNVFCSLHGKVTEADTRANIIDKVLVDVCCWPERLIQREKYVASRGYFDYKLIAQNRRFVAAGFRVP